MSCFHRYDPALVANTIPYDPSNSTSPPILQPCSDLALTALAALGISRLSGTRALISLFDRHSQHVVAEATPSSPLVPATNLLALRPDQALWLCGTAIPRANLCEHVLMQPEPSKSSTEKLPVTIISDISKHPDFAQVPGCCTWPHHRFYAGVPLRSRRGINIGVYCVFDTKPRSTFDEASIQLMQDVSEAVITHLETRLASSVKHSGDRMARGLGSFVEGKATMSGWQHNMAHNLSAWEMNEEGAFNKKQQTIQRQEDDLQDEETLTEPVQHAQDVKTSSTVQSNMFDSDTAGTVHSQGALNSPLEKVQVEPPAQEDIEEVRLRAIFSRAANIIRESIEVEGVVFLDACVGSRTAGYITVGSVSGRSNDHGRRMSSSSSSEEGSRTSIASEERDQSACSILGFSTSATSSIDGASPRLGQLSVPERFLVKLLGRYPRGKIFNFDEHGTMLSSDNSGSELTTTDDGKERSKQEYTFESQKRLRHVYARQNEGKVIHQLFPSARAVCLVPLWDHNRQRWFAGGFTYTKTPTRIFTVEGELSYLSAFGAVVMSDVTQLKAALVRSMTSDLLGSLSHELRSPLHGVTLGAELLRDTSLNVFQADVLRSLETCGRTLLDTINHLLHWTKINHFMSSSKDRHRLGGDSRPRKGRKSSAMNGMMHIASDIDLDILAEEVVECVYAGHVFQQQIESCSSGTQSPEESHVHFSNKVERMDTAGDTTQSSQGSVVVLVDIDPAVGWIFHAESGALRRIIMNLYGNSLKYTRNGFIRVNLYQESSNPPTTQSKDRTIKIVITDTGCGMGEDYIRHRIFSPFAQEDMLSPGAGLGLSLVKQIVKAMRGSIEVKSKLNCGTRVTVTLPMRAVDATTSETEEYKLAVSELSQLRVALTGFAGPPDHVEGNITDPSSFDEGELLRKLCQDHLRLHVVDANDPQGLFPDLMLCDHSQLASVMGRVRTETSPPVIVVCNSPTAARKLEEYYKSVNRRNKALFSYISRPYVSRDSPCYHRYRLTGAFHV